MPRRYHPFRSEHAPNESTSRVSLPGPGKRQPDHRRQKPQVRACRSARRSGLQSKAPAFASGAPMKSSIGKRPRQHLGNHALHKRPYPPGISQPHSPTPSGIPCLELKEQVLCPLLPASQANSTQDQKDPDGEDHQTCSSWHTHRTVGPDPRSARQHSSKHQLQPDEQRLQSNFLPPSPFRVLELHRLISLQAGS
ncbi:hypothetical protein ES703_70827 [subsurface metagenome]